MSARPGRHRRSPWAWGLAAALLLPLLLRGGLVLVAMASRADTGAWVSPATSTDATGATQAALPAWAPPQPAPQGALPAAAAPAPGGAQPRLSCGSPARHPVSSEDLSRFLDQRAAATDVLQGELVQALLARSEAWAHGLGVWLPSPAEPEAARRQALQLTAIAAGSADPQLVALTVATCSRLGYDGTPLAVCGPLDARYWARVDSSNGVPWLMVLEDAAERHDPAAEEEALRMLDAASRFDDYRSQTVARLMTVAQQLGMGPDAQLDLAVRALGRATSEMLPTTALIRHCPRTAPEASPEAQRCQRIGAQIEARGSALVLRLLGAGLLARVGEPDPVRGAQLRDDVRQGQRLFEDRGDADCGAVQRMTRFLARTAEVGETDALREALGKR